VKRPVLISFVLILLLSACKTDQDVASAPKLETAEAPSTTSATPDSIRANGILLPAREIDLGFGEAGMIKTVKVKVGEQVQAGQVLMELDNVDIQLEVEQAQNILNELTSPVAIAVAEEAVVNAQETYDDAKKKLDSLGRRYLDNTTRDYLEAQLVLAQDALDRAREAHKNTSKLSNVDPARARAATNLYNAQKEYNTAQWNLDWYTELPSNNEVALVTAKYDSASAALQEAKWYLSELKGESIPADATGPKLVQLIKARQTLQIVERRLERSRLVAPMDGVIAAIRIDPFEWTIPGETVVQILDVSYWRVMTRNVGELQIGHIHLGQEAHVVVNAFNGAEILGQVTEISPTSTVQQGDVTYTLLIDLEENDLNLRPGMTVQAEIIISTE